MVREEVVNQIKALEGDKAFFEDLFAQDTPEKIQAKFASKGIELTLDEVKEIVSTTVEAMESTSGSNELDETALDNVSGGFVAGAAIFLGMTAAGCYVGWKLAKGKC